MAEVKQLVFRPEQDTFDSVQNRVNNDYGSIHQIANRDLSRYYNILKYAIREVELSEKEAMAIIDSTNGTMLENVGIRMMYANIEDGIKFDGLAEKWEIDGEALVNKLKNASIGYLHALADAIERYWSKNDGTIDYEKLKSIGMVR